jgi:hypothetical protein
LEDDAIDGRTGREAKEEMGLRTGEILNKLCPGRNGPSDWDHILHNRWHADGDRFAVIDYGRGGKTLNQGQQLLKEGLLSPRKKFRYFLLDAYESRPEPKLRRIVNWVWPN